MALLAGVIALFTFVAVVAENCAEGPDAHEEEEESLCRRCTGGVLPSVNGQLISLRIARAV